MKNVIVHFRKIFGFTKTGRSVVGKHARQILSHQKTSRVMGTSLMALATAIFLIQSFSNIGGASVLAMNLQSVNTPKATIDASTDHTIQSPINFTYESRGFSWFHSGADLVAETGTPVHPIMPGVVEAVNHYNVGFGNHVIVKHNGGYESIYGHLSKMEVEPGEKVGLNTELGLSGSTGFSTGPHLHLEIHQNGQPVNPADLVPGVN